MRIAPSAFRIDEARGVSVPLPGARELDASVLAAAIRACPMRAISATAAPRAQRL